jgi:hypothetical protein
VNAIDDRVRAAREQFDLVTGDPAARDRFLAVFPGTGDPIAALIDASGLTSVSDEERHRLDFVRKIAFGRPDTGVDEAAAIEARQTLADAEARRAANAAAVDRAIELLRSADRKASEHTTPALLPDSILPAADEAGPPQPWRRFWILPIVLVAIAIGYVGGVATGSATEPSGAVSASPTIRPAATPEQLTFLTPPPAPPARPGDLVAAGRWFQQPPTPRDQFIQPSMLESMGIDPSNVRLGQVLTPGFSVWVAKKPDGSLCLLGGGADGAFGSCVKAEQFAATGIHMGDGSHLVDWDGGPIIITPTTP